MSSELVERAPAKVNLTLHVLGRRADGWHDLESLVAFAGAGDSLTLRMDGPLSLTVDGPAAAGAGPDADNLVLRAARRLAQDIPDLQTGAFRLTKRLPAAAGLGGGSSDAAAALRLLARANGLSTGDPRVRDAARASGADVLVCLEARARVMKGLGDQLGPALQLPPLFAVLVNPGAALETPKVFAKMGLALGQSSSGARRPPSYDLGSAAAFVASLQSAANHMEPAACALAPVVADALEILRASPGARLARMSGSGATCFGLFETRHAAARAAAHITGERPGWWVKATVLR